MRFMSQNVLFKFLFVLLLLLLFKFSPFLTTNLSQNGVKYYVVRVYVN